MSPYFQNYHILYVSMILEYIHLLSSLCVYDVVVAFIVHDANKYLVRVYFVSLIDKCISFMTF